MKLKDLLLALSSKTELVIYDCAGMPMACACAEAFQKYIRDTKRVNPRRKLAPMYYSKVSEIFPIVGEFAPKIIIQIDFEF